MEFAYPPEAEAFRDELKAWLADNLTDADRAATRGGYEGGSYDFDAARRWGKKLYDGRWACVAWPEEYGGRNATAVQQMVFEEEISRSGAPGHPNQLGIGEIGPAILVWGDDEQKARFVPRMLSADDMWCQGFSEPDAGSDLASLRLRAVRDGEEYVLDGQKIWNSGGDRADWCELLVRTDPDAPKHKGISCLLVDMHLPGIEVRPIRMLTGGSGFAELFFTAVRVPVSALLGPENDGWKVAHTTLAHERGVVINTHNGLRRQIQDLIERSRTAPLGVGVAADHPVIRHRIAELYATGEIMAFMADRLTAAQLSGKGPGPETALARFLWQDLSQGIAELEAELLGPDAMVGAAGNARAGARTNTIAGGTTEIHINNLAFRGLGLPRAY
jgi:alkylation response protein AidB-like acyl-CoA dehydrogenase